MADAQRSNDPLPPSTAGDQSRARDNGWKERLKGLLGIGGDISFRQSLETALEAKDPSQGGFSPEERLMLTNILSFRELRVDDVMVPRADIISVEMTIALGDLMKVFQQAGHSRIPVYRETLDDPAGMVHIKDLMAWLTAKSRNGAKRRAKGQAIPANPGGLDLNKINLAQPLSGARIVRPVLFVPPSMPAIDLLVKMQATRVHMAVVVDEYGGTDGLATIEDLVEEIVGDIEDEHDLDNALEVQWTEEGDVIADARLPIEDFEEFVGAKVALDETEDIDTLGGLIFSMLGRIPVRGEVVAFPGGLEIEVLDVDPRRIRRVKIYLKSRAATESRKRPAE